MKAVFRKERVHLAFSLYSVDPLLHESITLQHGSFKRTLSSIRWAVANDLPTRAAIIAMKRNESSVEETRQFLADVGVQEVVVDGIRGVGRGSSEAVSADPMDELCGECWNGKLCVTGSGDVYPCIMARFARVGRTNEGLDHLIRTTELVAFRSQVFRRHAASLSLRYESGCSPNVPDRIKCAPQVPCGPSSSYPGRSCAPSAPAPPRPPPH
jgi:MoaA/NifB/PqqE/SkfB family radical SAM enzyme